MNYFELSAADVSDLSDGDLRELVGRLCEAELLQQALHISGVLWGGAQEAADGGLDVSVRVPEGLKRPDFVPRAETGIQVKKHSMGKAACTKEMLENGATKPIIATLANRQGAYIIVSGKDDCSEKMLNDRLDGMKAAVTSLHNHNDLKLDFYGRDRIAAWMRKHPGVSLWARHKLGKPMTGWRPYGRWAATPSAMDDGLLADQHPCVFPANSHGQSPLTLFEGIELVKKKLQYGGGTVRITGLSGVGKTRFAQALFEGSVGERPLPHANAIYADLGDDLAPTASELVTFLIANDVAAYLVLDNCPPDVHRTLQQKVTSSATKLRLLTIEYDISDDRPEETEVIHLEPVSEETVSKLVARRFPELGIINCNKVAEFSGGNARVALALASRVEADETLTKFSDQHLFQRLFSQRKGASDSLLKSAELLSLVYSFSTSEADLNDELAALGRIANIDRGELHRHQAELLRRQIAQKRGKWRAVLPHALANRLARHALENLTITQINAELFRPENERIFKSCAHRVGYLHDCEAARDLAESWIAVGAPLHDVSACSSEQFACLAHFAPVFPETVLSALEKATAQSGFASRDNPSFIKVVRLLCQLSYDDSTFDRAANLVLRFAETEGAGEKNNSIVGQMKHLFSLHLSGTEASPSRRQAFVSRLFSSRNPRHLEIASELMSSALETSYWTSYSTFDFGARRRGTGWYPSTDDEQRNWYEGYIAILEHEALRSKERLHVDIAKRLVARHFRNLWFYGGCLDTLERIVRDHSKGGVWPELWIAIKSTIDFHGENHNPALINRLKTLEEISAPHDAMSEMEAYVLTNTREHARVGGGNRSEAVDSINEKIIKLGKIARGDTTYIERLGDRLWEKHIDAIWMFGRGLARENRDKEETFKFLVGLVDGLSLDRVHPVILNGFIREVHEESPALVKKLLEEVLEHEKLKDHFVYLVCAAPLESWGINKLIELARDEALEAWNFVHLSYYRFNEAICDEDLAELIDAIARLSNGVAAALQILEMRFFVDKDSDYHPTAPILSAGRGVIKILVAMNKDEVRHLNSHEFDSVCEHCLGVSAPIAEVSEIAKLLFDGIDEYRLYSFELCDLISPLVKNFPEVVLDCLLGGRDSEEPRRGMVFRDRSNGMRQPSLNEASIERLIAWCGGEQDKLGKLAELVCPYTTLEEGGTPSQNPSKVKLSDHILAILDLTEDQPKLIEAIFERIVPSSWSGSLADILEVRGRALESLLDHPSPDVREIATAKLKAVEQAVQRNRASEAREFNSREQRFE